MYNTLAECPVPCLQHEGELQEFLEIYKEMQPKKVLEIGSFYGGTLWFFIKNNPDKLETLISLDMLIPQTDKRYNEMIESRSKWNDWCPFLLDFYTFEGNSRDQSIIETIKKDNYLNEIDLLHIDGDHSYEGVKADYENFKSLVKPGGIIVFHDVVGIETVARFWNELKEQFPESFRTISHENGWGIGILQV